MAVFEYSGFDKSGARVTGSVEAATAESAQQILRQQGILLKSVAPEKPLQADAMFGSGRVDLADIEFLTAELSLLLDSGLKIDKGIDLLKSANKKPALAKLLNKISTELRSGKQLSQVLAGFNDLFDPLYINLISIGEKTGRLAAIFRQLAEDLAFKRDLQKKISQALTYPAVILFVCVASVLFIFNYVVPNMATMFERQQDLPFYTVMLLSSSAWLQQYQLLLFGAIALSIFLLFYYRKNKVLQQRWQWLAIRLPLFKPAILLVERIRFNGGLAMMLDAGVAIDQALELANGNIKHSELRAEMQIAISKIKRGDQLSVALRQTRLFPDFFASLLSVGEESGELARIFKEIAQRSQRQFTDWVSRFTSLLEPLLILVMGGIVGGVVVIMMLSITSATDVGL
ncbi:type II secretion system F family protein [Arsukibacterium indicum]|uniref:Type II secretion system F family protein n=1 Tax=Arsukibacterium indicum TaxID=2848612 RepID=A0ABS6MG42_9GAMM|nr:type II secretion system F family protein [Arsukibacterium indicum]MBV2127791.1 type II secretion system F family protein [Arsukibacterium indicum]